MNDGIDDSSFSFASFTSCLGEKRHHAVNDGIDDSSFSFASLTGCLQEEGTMP